MPRCGGLRRHPSFSPLLLSRASSMTGIARSATGSGSRRSGCHRPTVRTRRLPSSGTDARPARTDDFNFILARPPPFSFRVASSPALVFTFIKPPPPPSPLHLSIKAHNVGCVRLPWFYRLSFRASATVRGNGVLWASRVPPRRSRHTRRSLRGPPCSFNPRSRLTCPLPLLLVYKRDGRKERVA